MPRFGTAFMVAMAGTAAMAATADAATLTITPVKACYLTREVITATGAGFTPNGAVEVKLDSTSLGQRPAMSDGTFAVTITLGTMRAVKSHALSATDVTNPAVTAGASFMGTQNIVTVKPKDAEAGDKLRIRGYGFLAGPRVYMHVRGHGYSRDKRVGRTTGPCGTFATRERIIPATATPGFYRVQFDAQRRYSKKTTPRVKGRMHVFRKFSATPARASAFAGVVPSTRGRNFAAFRRARPASAGTRHPVTCHQHALGCRAPADTTRTTPGYAPNFRPRVLSQSWTRASG